MIGFGLLAMLIALVGLWTPAQGAGSPRPPAAGSRLLRGAWARAVPADRRQLGWIFTEMGRQPWLVFGEMKTSTGVSADVGRDECSPR